ncbi:MAG: DUF423 domain-containing protein [Pseudomonadota bacterium]
MVLVIGAFLGFLAVAMGAYSEHGLIGSISQEQLLSIRTAIRYQQIHSLVIVAIGLVIATSSPVAKTKGLAACGVLFITGTVVFSFSIFVSVLMNAPGIAILTPVGGIIIMFAWLSLFVFGLRVWRG